MTDELIGKTLADKYIIEELLRESDFGNTYRGTHLMMENSVTIKILSPALAVDENIVERFSVEARTISRLSHPNMLNVTDFGKDDDTVFIVTEFSEGETLKDAIKREGAFSIERAVKITRQIAAALSAAHASRVIHQNLTSDKVLLMPMGLDSELVKVLDVGSFEVDNSRDFEDGESFDELAYLSPEQCTQESDADERSDIYSLGIIFYEVLTGDVPFTADTATDLMMKHSQSPPPPLVAFRDDVPEDIEPILLNAMAKNPDKRYQSAAAFADDLHESVRVEDEDETIVIPNVNDGVAEVDGNNSAWKTAFIVLAGISLMAFGFIYWTNMKQTDPATIVKTDENGKPVQPLNPATGLNEQNLPNMDQFPSNSLSDMDPSLLPPDVGGTGGGYGNPWDNSPVPPMGAPVPIGQGGDTVTLGEGNSIFTKDQVSGDTVILVPKAMPDTPEGTPKTGDAKTDKTGDKAKVDATKTDGTKTDKTPVKPKTDGAKPETGKTDKTPAKPKADKPKPETPKKKIEKKPSKKETAQPSSKNRKLKSGVEQDT